MEVPREILNNLQKKYRDSSINTFKYNIVIIFKGISKLTKKEVECKILTFKPYRLYNTKKVLKFISENPKMMSRKNMISSIVAFLKATPKVKEGIIQIYEVEFKKLIKINEDLQEFKEPSEENMENWVSWDEIMKKFEEYSRKIEGKGIDTFAERHLYQKYLILGLYTMIPPQRGEIFYNCIVVELNNPTIWDYEQISEGTKKNLIDIKNNKLISAYYKTSDKYGFQVLDIPKKLSEIIRKWIKITGSQSLLLSIQSRKPLTQQAFTAYLNRIFEPKKISSSMLRNIYISDILTKRIPKKDRKRIAREMKHSLATQTFIYSKFEEF